MDKQLLIEYTQFNITPQQLNEALQTNGKLIVSGVIQRAEVPNQNGRVYPLPILKREAEKYNKKFIANKQAIGELDHPNSDQISLKNVSHNILELWWKGNDLCAKIEILTTPSGNILRELIKNGITVGISSRGMGSVKEISEAVVEVQDDFEILCWDFVSTPSTQGAFMSPINESKSNNIPVDKYAKVKEIINNILIS